MARRGDAPVPGRRLLWRPVGILVRFVVVHHPRRGTILLMCTDLTLCPLDIIRIYGLRFKIEVSFQQALRVIGAYAYHFWMAAMTPLRRVSGNQHLHRKSDAYRNAVRRKIAAYHRHIPLGLIAQGLLQILSATKPTLIWQSFARGSGPFDQDWPLRTGRRHRPPQYPPGISRKCRQNLNPREIHPRPAGPVQNRRNQIGGMTRKPSHNGTLKCITNLENLVCQRRIHAARELS